MQYLALCKLQNTINKEPDMVKAHHIYYRFEAATAVDTTLACAAVCEDLDEMTDADPTGTTATATKELGPNNPEQAKAFKEAADKH